MRRCAPWLGPAVAASVVKSSIKLHRAVAEGRQERNRTELAKLLAIAPQSLIPEKSKKRIAASAIIAATAFQAGTVREGSSSADPSLQLHDGVCADANSGAFLTPLYALATDTRFVEKPCKLCLAQRLHAVACEDFCNDVHGNSIKEEETVSGCNNISEEFRNAIVSSFGSVDAFLEELKTYAAARRSPGFTWVVWCDQKQQILVVNFPRLVSPTTHGLWPLASLDISDGALASVYQALSDTATETHGVVPSWSRAARNPAASVTQTAAAGSTTVTRAALLDGLLNYYTSHLNWEFMQGQLQAAKTYYASPARVEKQATRRAHLGQVASKKAMEQWETSEEAPEEQQAAAAATTVKSTSVETSSSPDKHHASTSSTVAAEAQQSHQAQDYTVTKDELGVITYTFNDGSITIVNPIKGSTIRHDLEGHVTTEFNDGWMFYQPKGETPYWYNRDLQESRYDAPEAHKDKQ